ncbi:MAG: GNAT family N-acetyltransferase [Cyanobacteria bacterium P01_C01_bin.72]
MSDNIRAVKPQDVAAIKAIIDANELFPSQMLDEMMSGYFTNSDSEELWLTYDDSNPKAIAFCAPEQMTEGTWNLYLIAVHPDFHRQGIGKAMIRHIEHVLLVRGVRILLVETSGLDSFKSTRTFYLSLGYEQEAQIREFYAAGEDKIIFRKALVNDQSP